MKKFFPRAQIAVALAALGLVAWGPHGGRHGGRYPQGPSPECDPAGMVERIVVAFEGGESVDRPTRRGPRHGPNPRHLGRIYDANENSTLDETERAEMLADLTVRCENIRAAMLEEHDANGDGEIDESEKEVARAAVRANRHERHAANMVEKHDTDGDGKLSLEELQAARPEKRGPPKDPIAKFDNDGDGVLDEQEKALRREAMRERIRSGERCRPF